jgi:hypothetical protein
MSFNFPKVSSYNLSRTIFADSSAAANGDGSAGFPFNSLQAAINAAEALGPAVRKLIVVASGSAFDEDVVVTGGLLEIIGLGPFTLGDGLGSAFSSTVARNFTWHGDAILPDGKWPSLSISTEMNGETSSTHAAYMNGFVISGNLILTEALSHSRNLFLRNVKVSGNFAQTGSGGIQSFIRRCFFDNTVTGPALLFNIVESTEFDGLLSILQYCRIWQCQIQGGMTVTGVPIASVPPVGMFQTDFSGAFTGPIASLQLDAATNYFFVANAASLAGGATKVLMHDLTP